MNKKDIIKKIKSWLDLSLKGRGYINVNISIKSQNHRSLDYLTHEEIKELKFKVDCSDNE